MIAIRLKNPTRQDCPYYRSIDTIKNTVDNALSLPPYTDKQRCASFTQSISMLK